MDSGNYAPISTEEGVPASPPPGTPSRTSRLVVLAVGAAVIGSMAFIAKSPVSVSTTTLAADSPANLPPVASTASDIASQKITYGTMSDDDIAKIFDDFVAKYKKPYADDEDTKAIRFTQFKSNLGDIDQYNARNPLAVYGITDRTDWTDDERARMRGLKSSTLSKVPGETRSSFQIMKDNFPDQQVVALGEKGPAFVEAEAAKRDAFVSAVKADTSYEVEGEEMSEAMFPWITASDCAACKMFPHFADYTWGNMPDNFDWRELGAVSPVLNQKYCGSCWTFSTAQDIEGTHFLATGDLNPLSEQQLVACDPGNDGCDGGWPFRAMQYVHLIGGLVKSVAMPYKGICAWDACDENADGADDPTPTCDTATLVNETMDDNVAAIGGYQLVAMGAEYESLAMVALVKNGPLSIAFNAAGMDYYLHGIVGCNVTMDDGEINAGCIQYDAGDGEWTCDPEAIDHAVLIVGYGTQNDVPYWVIKNSWSEYWGEDGYYRIVRGINECGVANMIVHSVVKDALAQGLETVMAGGGTGGSDDVSGGGSSKTSGGHNKKAMAGAH